jgi:type I restriction enzyme S subunit
MALNIPRQPDKENGIAEVLSNLADKIELNRQTNQTLEQIAQAIFKSWFVDFEPVKAKIQAKRTLTPTLSQRERELIVERAAMCAISGKSLEELEQLSPETQQQLKTTAALFPDALVESELREIPEGWEVKPLDKIAHYQNGLALQKFRPDEDEDSLPVLKIAQLKKGFADGEEKAKVGIKPECIVHNGDVVFSWSGSLIVDVWCGGKAALNQHLFKVTSKNYPKYHLKIFQQIAADKAVTMGHIKREHLSQAKCVIPSCEMESISVLSDLLEKQIEQRVENFTLRKLRDTLLPKLLSGELTPSPTAIKEKAEKAEKEAIGLSNA